MTNYQQLANELKDALARYRPVAAHDFNRRSASLRRTDPLVARKYYLKWRAKNPPRTAAGKRWGKVGLNRILKNLSELLGISTSAARGRYYRNQVPKRIVEQAKAKNN